MGGIASLSLQPTAKHMLLGPWLLLVGSEEGLGTEGTRGESGGYGRCHVPLHLICLGNDEDFPRLVICISMYII